MRLHALQYLRAAAALVVVYSHAALQVENYLPHLPQLGGFGVDVFFVISGFIMVWITKPTDTPGRFIVNRVRRVVPLYWFFTLLMALVLIAAPTVFKRSTFDIGELALSLAFIPFDSTTYPGWLYPIVAPGWSLNYEIYFYALFALSLTLAPRYRVGGAVALLVAVFLALRLIAPESVAGRFYADDIVFEFVFGMLLAAAWLKGFRLSPFVAAMLVGAGTVGLLLHLPLPRSIAFGLPALAVVTGCLFVDLPERRWAVVLGDASYALYLSHLFVLGVLRAVLPPVLGDGALAAWLFVAISLVVCTLASLPVHFLVDNWLLRRERLGALRSPSGPTTPGTAPERPAGPPTRPVAVPTPSATAAAERPASEPSHTRISRRIATARERRA